MASRADLTATWIEALARSARVARALELAEQEADWVTERHIQLTRIPAPTFGEKVRADYFLEQFREMRLQRARLDGAGNVLAEIPGTGAPRGRGIVAVTAHLDTVFPASRVEVYRQNGRIYGPGVTDNGAGLAALLGLARLFTLAGVRMRDTLLLVANVAEEGEGNLFGMRHLLEQPEIRKQVRYMLILDGANLDHITAHALGSLRFLVTVEGPGGHSWTDFGMANPIYALAAAVSRLSAASVPAHPRTTFNVGQVEGGTSINSIPFSASMKVDIRSSSAEEIQRLAGLLEKAVRQAVDEENQRAHSGRLTCQIKEIGERPAAELPENARVLQTVKEVDRHLGIRSRVERSSTDANIPLALGIEALSLGAGGNGGAAHSPQEWYDPALRPLGLRRLVLTICALAGAEEELSH